MANYHGYDYKIEKTYSYQPYEGIYYLIRVLHYSCPTCNSYLCAVLGNEKLDSKILDLEILNCLFTLCSECREYYGEVEAKKIRTEEIFLFRVLTSEKA